MPVALSDAAQEYLRGRTVGVRSLGYRHARGKAIEIRHARHAALFELCAVHGSNRDGRRLQALFAELSGDEDLLQELNAGGRVSKKTQLAMEDSARMAEEMPTN